MKLSVNYQIKWEEKPSLDTWLKATTPFGLCEIVQVGYEYKWYAFDGQGSEDNVEAAKSAVQRQLETQIISVVKIDA